MSFSRMFKRDQPTKLSIFKNAEFTGWSFLFYTRAVRTAAILSKEFQVDIAVETDLHEWLVNAAGIKTVSHALIKMRGTYAYITKRIDRSIHGDEAELSVMEDFRQSLNRITSDKYKASYGSCGKPILLYYSHSSYIVKREIFCETVREAETMCFK